jgi:hypothetical protein
MFQSYCHPQGAHTDVVKTYSNQIAPQYLYIHNVQILVKKYSIKMLL